MALTPEQQEIVDAVLTALKPALTPTDVRIAPDPSPQRFEADPNWVPQFGLTNDRADRAADYTAAVRRQINIDQKIAMDHYAAYNYYHATAENGRQLLEAELNASLASMKAMSASATAKQAVA